MTWLIVWSSLLFALGLLLGALWGWGRGERAALDDLEERAEERRAARWLDRVRETRGGTVMPYRPPDGPSWPPATVSDYMRGIRAALPPPGDRTYGGKIHDIHGGPGEDCWCGYVGADHARLCGCDDQAVETDEEFTARLARRADAIIAAARLAPDPYDQLWTAQ